MSERGKEEADELQKFLDKDAKQTQLRAQLEVIFLSLCTAYREMGEQMKNFTIVYTEYMEQTND